MVADGWPPLIACVVVDATEYEPTLRAMWEAGLAGLRQAGKKLPEVYAGSTESHCQQCGVRIAVGPRQAAKLQELHQVHVTADVACLLCAAIVGRERYNLVVVNLGNPDGQ